MKRDAPSLGWLCATSNILSTWASIGSASVTFSYNVCELKAPEHFDEHLLLVTNTQKFNLQDMILKKRDDDFQFLNNVQGLSR